MGKPGFPIPRPRERLRGRSPRAEGWENQISPSPRPREGLGERSPPRNNLFAK